MSDKPNGGPAFPAETIVTLKSPDGAEEDVRVRSAGMTIRDYFAAKVLQGLVSIPEIDSVDVGYCYRIAEAMIAERERKTE